MFTRSPGRKPVPAAVRLVPGGVVEGVANRPLRTMNVFCVTLLLVAAIGATSNRNGEAGSDIARKTRDSAGNLRASTWSGIVPQQVDRLAGCIALPGNVFTGSHRPA